MPFQRVGTAVDVHGAVEEEAGGVVAGLERRPLLWVVVGGGVGLRS